jgi:hypothetical protein
VLVERCLIGVACIKRQPSVAVWRSVTPAAPSVWLGRLRPPVRRQECKDIASFRSATLEFTARRGTAFDFIAAVARRGRNYIFEALPREAIAMVVPPMPARVGRGSRKREENDSENK